MPTICFPYFYTYLYICQSAFFGILILLLGQRHPEIIHRRQILRVISKDKLKAAIGACAYFAPPVPSAVVEDIRGTYLQIITNKHFKPFGYGRIPFVVVK